MLTVKIQANNATDGYMAISMHETATIIEVVSELGRFGNPKRARLRLGAMRSEPERFREMFKEYVRGTPLEGTELDIEDVPVEVFCPCGFSGMVEVHEHVHFVRCPECGKVADITSGNEVEVEPINQDS